MEYICLYKEIALQNSLKYSFHLLSPARFSEFDGENSTPADAFSKNFSTRKISETQKLRVRICPPLPAATPLHCYYL